MKVFSDASSLDSWRALALEVMVTLAEMAPAMVRKMAGKYMEQLVPLILQFMADLEDEENWAESDELLDEDNDCNNVVAEAALDRLATGLGGKVILPLVTANIPMMLSSPDWKQRHAALMAISAIGEGCHKHMEPMLPQIMEGVPGVMESVLRYLQDPHPRVSLHFGILDKMFSFASLVYYDSISYPVFSQSVYCRCVMRLATH